MTRLKYFEELPAQINYTESPSIIRNRTQNIQTNFLLRTAHRRRDCESVQIDLFTEVLSAIDFALTRKLLPIHQYSLSR